MFTALLPRSQAVGQVEGRRRAFVRTLTFDLHLDSQGFGNAAQEDVNDARLLQIVGFLTLVLISVGQDAEILWWEGCHPHQHGHQLGGHFRQDATQ